MTAVRHVSGHSTGLATTASSTVYAPVGNTLLASHATEANRSHEWYAAGTFKTLRTLITANGTASSSTISMKVAGSTNLTISVGSAATGTFEDTTNTHSVSAGDAVVYSIVTGLTNGLTIQYMSVDFFSTTEALAHMHYLLAGSLNFSTGSSTRYAPIAGRNGLGISTEVRANEKLRAAGTAKNLWAYVSANARTTTTTITSRKNSAAGAQTVSYGSGVTGQVEDTSNTDSLAATDTLNYRWVTSTGSETISLEMIGVMVEFTDVSKRQFIASIGAVNGTSMSGNNITEYMNIIGDLNGENSSATDHRVPLRKGVISYFQLYISTNGRSGASNDVFRPRINGSIVNSVISVSLGATGAFEDTSNTDAIADGDQIDLRVVWASVNGTITVHRFSFLFDVNTALTVNDAAHAHAADNVVLTAGGNTDLVVADGAHAHAADNVVLTQAHVLEVADALHAHAADNTVLTQAHVLTVADALHGHAADNLVLTQAQVLAIADALHAHSADNVVLTQAHTLVIADALHSHSADNVTLTFDIILTIADALHAHTADNLTLTYDTLLTIAEALHAHTADNLAITQSHSLVIADATHGHTVDNVVLVLTVSGNPGSAIVAIVAPRVMLEAIAPEVLLHTRAVRVKEEVVI